MVGIWWSVFSSRWSGVALLGVGGQHFGGWYFLGVGIFWGLVFFGGRYFLGVGIFWGSVFFGG